MSCAYLHQRVRAIVALFQRQWQQPRSDYSRMESSSQISPPPFSSSSQNRAVIDDLDPPSEGFFPVYVGSARQRFLLPIRCLGHASVRILLEQCEEEFGFAQSGSLALPCNVELFELAVEQAEESFRLEALESKHERKEKRSLRKRIALIRSAFR
ncbi:uncharacterized protein LOC9643791 [Selaginella moellendorffii]|nr:uncharacterized protein LOC9643791 [Selaginella moellendorffii]|eukprot:XP_024524220.1 uncharacterized protein LOC9643791 [Selaginella moellendorffii]